MGPAALLVRLLLAVPAALLVQQLLAAPSRPPDLLPRLRRDDHRFLPLPTVRPETAVLTGEHGLAHAIHRLRAELGLPQPLPGDIKTACHPEQVERLRGWLTEEIVKPKPGKFGWIAVLTPAESAVKPLVLRPRPPVLTRRPAATKR